MPHATDLRDDQLQYWMEEERRIRRLIRSDAAAYATQFSAPSNKVTKEVLTDAYDKLSQPAVISRTWFPANPTGATNRGDGFADVFMSDGSMHRVQLADSGKNVPTARLRVKLKTGAKPKSAAPVIVPSLPEKMQGGNAVRLNGETKTFDQIRREKGNDDALRFMIALFNEMGFHVAEMRQVRRGGGHAMFRVTRGGT